MDLGGVSRSLFLCLLFGYPKNLLKFTLANSGSPPAEQTSLKGSGTADNPTQPDQGEKTPIELNVKTKKKSNEYNYSCASGIGTYVASSGFGFNLVKRDNEVIWETENKSEYATKVVSNGLKFCSSITNVTVHLVNGAIIEFSKQGSTWKGKTIQKARESEEKPKPKEQRVDNQPKVESPKAKPEDPNHIEIDLENKKSTHQYVYQQEGDVETYTVKENFLIRSYKEGDNVKWTSDGSKYLKKVVRTRISDGVLKYQFVTNKPVINVGKTSSAQKAPPEGKKRDNDNGPNTSQPKECVQPKEIVIITQELNDNALLTVNDTKQYKVAERDEEYFIEFNAGSKCVELIINGVVVWEYGTKGINECPRIFRINKLENVMVIFGEANSISRMKSCFDETWLTWS